MLDLTIGMPTYRDWDGVWSTIEALRLYHDLTNVEILVVDNFGCKYTGRFCEQAGVKYILANRDPVGTAITKNKIFEHARGDVVLCIDCHVMLHTGCIESLLNHFSDHPQCDDLLHGPMIHDDHSRYHVEMADNWRGHMWGVWLDEDMIPAGELPAAPWPVHHMGMGLFAARRESWLPFHGHFRGFGGEEGYLAEKYRQHGRQCVQVPGMAWSHRFGRTFGIPYPLNIEDKFRNYAIGCRELDIDMTDCLEHFKKEISAEAIFKIIDDVDRIFNGRESTREQIVPDTSALAEAMADIGRLSPMDFLILRGRLMLQPEISRPAAGRPLPPGLQRRPPAGIDGKVNIDAAELVPTLSDLADGAER